MLVLAALHEVVTGRWNSLALILKVMCYAREPLLVLKNEETGL